MHPSYWPWRVSPQIADGRDESTLQPCVLFLVCRKCDGLELWVFMPPVYVWRLKRAYARAMTRFWIWLNESSAAVAAANEEDDLAPASALLGKHMSITKASSDRRRRVAEYLPQPHGRFGRWGSNWTVLDELPTPHPHSQLKGWMIPTPSLIFLKWISSYDKT